MKKKYGIGAVSAVIFCGLVAGAGYVKSGMMKPDLSRIQVSEDVSGDLSVGIRKNLQFEVDLPLDVPAPEISLQAPENTVPCGTPSVSRHYRWDRNRWHCKAGLAGFRPGKGGGGRILISVRTKEGVLQKSLSVPDFAILAGKAAPGEELALAEALPEKSRRAWIWMTVLGGILLLFAVAGAVIFFRRKRRKSPQVLSPWENALRELRLLSELLDGRQISLGEAVAHLTDIVRKYLETRYLLPVTSRTTEEFMEEMRRESPLPEEERPFLREFLQSADLIKFAKVPPEDALIRHAVKGAEALVRHTVPAETEKGASHA